MTDKELWFKNQCEAEGISAEDIMVFGEYATNKDGDFLYSVKHEDGSYTMNCVAAKDVTPHELDNYNLFKEDNRACWLLNLMNSLEENYREGDEILQSRSWWDRKDIAMCFKEAVCRNQDLKEHYRMNYRNRPAYGVFPPIRLPREEEGPRGVYMGLRNLFDEAKHVDENGFEYELVLRSIEFEGEPGYRYATKVIDVEKFIETYGNIQSPKQHGSMRILADLEESVKESWAKGEVRSSILVRRTEGEDDFVEFRFSHFEQDYDPDDKYRTLFVVYGEQFDV